MGPAGQRCVIGNLDRTDSILGWCFVILVGFDKEMGPHMIGKVSGLYFYP